MADDDADFLPGRADVEVHVHRVQVIPPHPKGLLRTQALSLVGDANHRLLRRGLGRFNRVGPKIDARLTEPDLERETDPIRQRRLGTASPTGNSVEGVEP